MSIIQSIESALAILTGIVNWKMKNPLTIAEKDSLNALLVPDYYIILTRNNNHLSSYMIGLSDLFLEGKFGYWGHALMNMEDAVVNKTDFRFIEAIGTGVTYATFDTVMEVNSIVLLKPKNMSVTAWTAVLDTAKADVGKPYDTLFDMKQDKKLSCVELVRHALMADPDYHANFSNFENMVQTHGRITPQMLYDCGDFEVVYEVRH